jgi:hypothetical protein
VPRTRLELARPCEHQPLKLACLPISPPGQNNLKQLTYQFSVSGCKNNLFWAISIFMMNYFDNFECLQIISNISTMLSEKDLKQMQSKGINPLNIEKQINNYKAGFPFMQLVAPATPGHGIIKLDETEVQRLASNYLDLTKGREIIKFVPASGAASRMFKTLFEFQEELEQSDKNKPFTDKSFNSPQYFFDNIKNFAFYEDLEETMAAHGHDFSELLERGDYSTILDQFLGEPGLNYANLPKGLLKFHRYQNEPARTAIGRAPG